MCMCSIANHVCGMTRLVILLTVSIVDASFFSFAVGYRMFVVKHGATVNSRYFPP